MKARKIKKEESGQHKGMDYVLELSSGSSYFTAKAFEELQGSINELLPSHHASQQPKGATGGAEQRQELFNHLQNEHDLTCLESELDYIINICQSFATSQSTISDSDIDKEFPLMEGNSPTARSNNTKNGNRRVGAKWCKKWLLESGQQYSDENGICYKSNKPCKHNCSGLCKESV